ncbi:hypothetical protein P3X46_033481 [Hevea brasiliensis]|uniref:Uncharacterized protein n=1 Tax=Hevea brasiliensis TaxID=3981 RepID=A0ABQ9KJF5_HEVBR|nr:uncharacterized protein LOC110668677 [Hevea brasiliensis]XP_021685691.2 uncharacterized protein LOC110668677 [Hevea brasiliensis]KAJ9136397.1 hypothetical protein P3X46_033481 [Hevea brasiliensis]KAJ9136398.1 hypothetical protein P3X46_033481 [Hevea brasiliensis]
MDSPRTIPSQAPQLLLSPCSSGRRSSDSNSPEFEFWMVRNPSFPEPDLLSADELFVDGVLLPLHLLHLHNHHSPDPPDSKPDPKLPNSHPDAEPRASPKTITADSSTASKRWRDIFKKGDKKTSTRKNQEDKDKEKDKEKKREKKSQGGASSAELNINIWPFSRSRSAGNSGGRPRMFPGAAGSRKVSSAPCSRSNSGGESKSRKWPSSPGRGGVHVGRSSPVWQVRRGGGFSEAVKRSSEKMKSKRRMEGGKVVNLEVPLCNGYRQCRSNENRNGGSSNVGGNVFNLRSFFTKKVY